MKNLIVVFRLIVLVTVLFPAGARGDDTVIELRFENRRFTPQTITVPANQPFKTSRLQTEARRPIEFESFKLNRERVAGPGETIIISATGFASGKLRLLRRFSPGRSCGIIIAK